MKSLTHLKKMVMDGMLVQSEIDKFTSEGILNNSNPQIKSPVNVEKWNFSPRITSSANRMSLVYIAFFCLENSVRELIVERLFERYGNDWWEKCVAKNIKDNVDKLKKKEEKNRYHTPRSSTNIGYTLFGEMSKIIINNWDDFSDILPSQHWIMSRFEDLEMSRNVIMHSGTLPDNEIDRIKTYVEDWVNQVG